MNAAKEKTECGLNAASASRSAFIKAALLCLTLCAAAEALSAAVLHIAKKDCGGPDLIKFDSHFLCGNFKKYHEHEAFEETERKRSPSFRSVQELTDKGPYDLVIFGDSFGHTGWASLLRERYGYTSANLTAVYREGWAQGFSRAARHAGKNKTGGEKTVWIFATLTERSGYSFIAPEDFKTLIAKPGPFRFLPPPKKRLSYTGRLAENLMFRRRYKETFGSVMELPLGKEDHLFYKPDLEGLFGWDKKRREDLQPDLMLRQFREAKEIAGSKDVLLAMVFFPSKPQVYDWLLEPLSADFKVREKETLETLKETAARAGIFYLDLEEGLKPAAKKFYDETGKVFWHRGDAHMNLSGDAAAAKLISAFIEKIQKTASPS